jgi:hypothetical protein
VSPIDHHFSYRTVIACHCTKVSRGSLFAQCNGEGKALTNSHIKTGEAQDASKFIERMVSAGFFCVSKPRWYGAGISLTVTIGFAPYALEDPKLLVRRFAIP